jgi:DNA-binding GntR family transcriptional regulator
MLACLRAITQALLEHLPNPAKSVGFWWLRAPRRSQGWTAATVSSKMRAMKTDPTLTAGSADPSGKAGQIAVELERRLLLGQYVFGQALSITQLAQQFSASRQPVSVAISHLRSSGYVEVIPQVGCRVVSPSVSEIADFFVALGKIESAVAGFAASRHETDEPGQLIAIAARAVPESLESIAEREAYVRDVGDFHDQIWRMARSPALQGRVSNLRRLSNFYLWQGAAKPALPTAQILTLERRKIAQAIADRDIGLSQSLMEKHISHKPHVNGLVKNPPG